MKTCIITGAAEGTGYVVAERFLKAGYAVCITSRRAEKAEKAAQKLQQGYQLPAWGFGVDPMDLSQVESMYAALDEKGAEIGAIVLVAADLGIGQPPFETPLADWKRVIDTNVIWNYSMVEHAAGRMKKTGGGAIVFVGSNTAVRAIPNRSAYIASKAALQGLSKALAVDLGPDGIRSNVIICGNIENERFLALDESVRQERCQRAPIGHIAAYEDVAELCYFLGSPLSRVITGAEVALDGGVLAQLMPIKR